MKHTMPIIWLILSIACSGCWPSSHDSKINLTISGTAVKHENGIPVENVKVVLYRTKPGFFRDQEESVSEAMTDIEGRYIINVKVEESSCEAWSYWINAWLYIVKEPEVPRQIDKEIPIQCEEENQEFELRLKK